MKIDEKGNLLATVTPHCEYLDIGSANLDEQTLEEIANKCEHKYYFVIMRRVMLRVAGEIAKKLGYDTISTGENLGQVGSQTLDNLAVTDRATDLVVLRPILCNDKTETIKIAEQIGTFEI